MKRTILIVEDDENDRIFESIAFEAIGLQQLLQFVTDGQQAIDYLQGCGPFADRARHPIPHLVLLDLNLPHVKGLDVLHWIRVQPRFHSMVVIPLTASNNPEDIEAARRLGANDYLVKPISLGGWRAMSWQIERCWLHDAAARPRSWGTLARGPIECRPSL